ncbi:MAG: sensor histidine kinase [Flavipsychrobacter sp.]
MQLLQVGGPYKIMLLGIAGMLSLAIAIVLFVVFYQRKVIAHQEQLNKLNRQKEKELTEAAIRAEEDERMRIAAELHDDVGATLASVRLYLRMADREGARSEAFTQSQQLIDESINKVRSLSHRLQPAMLQKLGLQMALQSFFDVFNKSGVIQIDFSGAELPMLDENKSLALYRIMQELVNNTLKHAGADRAEVHAERVGNDMQLRFSHNGKQGITQERFQEYIYKKDATGLKNIMNRLKVFNGSLSFDKEENWYHTIIHIPM